MAARRSTQIRRPAILGGHIDRVDLATGRVDRLYERCGEYVLSAPNDLVFDRHGGFWFTDFGPADGAPPSCIDDLLRQSRRQRNPPRDMSAGVSFNGIGLSADERTLYAADTSFRESCGRFRDRVSGRDRERDGTARRGALRSRRCRVRCRSTASRSRSRGAVCIGTIGPGGIAIVSSDGSVEQRPMQDDYVTNIAFGGPELRTAFITMVSTGRLIRTEWPEPGQPLNFLNV